MKIGLVGFFGWGNFGDELFVAAHMQFLSHLGEVKPIHDIMKKPYFTRPVENVVEEFDALVIGGGDLIIPWTVSELYWKKEYLKKPVHVVGVGVPTWGGIKKDKIEIYRKFFQSPSVKTLIARDQKSADWINDNLEPNIPAIYHPDLVCAMELPPVEKSTDKILGVVLRHRKGGKDDLKQVRNICVRAKKFGYSIRLIVLGNMSTGKLDVVVAKEFAEDDEELIYTEDINEMCVAIGECSALTSMKFHGTIVAAMYGIPSYILSATDKNRNFAHMIERPDLITSIQDKKLFYRLPYNPAPINQLVVKDLKMRAIEGYDKLITALERNDS